MVQRYAGFTSGCLPYNHQCRSTHSATPVLRGPKVLCTVHFHFFFFWRGEVVSTAMGGSGVLAILRFPPSKLQVQIRTAHRTQAEACLESGHVD